MFRGYERDIFDQVQDVPLGSASRLVGQLASQQAAADLQDAGGEYTPEEVSQAVGEARSGIVAVSRVDKSSDLYAALTGHWYQGHDDMVSHIGQPLVEADDALYFSHGANYDWISQDLLGGKADGQAKRQFLEGDTWTGWKAAADMAQAMEASIALGQTTNHASSHTL
ncbi:hypothetical protein CRD60_04595 [Bifidobacterium aemilianum]|uniref:Uncharacterized protein n=1 Tax=Bifidobacterium aemilianum TaxID=2493120 RepID=A0A366K871_9BIFI|nr:hypothetical protein [Bifidobacterium aemilianum]RBP97869.1 hypothetical protein CRD60_04595 [Bifidobacterium aemilianum]